MWTCLSVRGPCEVLSKTEAKLMMVSSCSLTNTKIISAQASQLENSFELSFCLSCQPRPSSPHTTSLFVFRKFIFSELYSRKVGENFLENKFFIYCQKLYLSFRFLSFEVFSFRKEAKPSKHTKLIFYFSIFPLQLCRTSCCQETTKTLPNVSILIPLVK
jgi:hypothetical protein